MIKRHLALTAMAMACGVAATNACAQSTDELQQALKQARDAAARAQAAADAAEAALARLQQQAAVQAAPAPANASPSRPVVDARGAQLQAQTSGLTTTVTNEALPQGLYFTGNIDLGVRNLSSSDKTKNKTEVLNNLSSTSQLFFRGKKDLTDDLNTSFLLEIDFNPTQGSLGSSTAGANAYQGTPFNGEEYVSLQSRRFGEVKIGVPNSAMFVASLTAQPLSTAIGSGYSNTFGRLGTAAVSGVIQYEGTPGRVYRHEKTITYATPTYAGFKAGAEYSFLNDDSTTVTSNNNRYTAVSAAYNAGALNAMVVHAKVAAGAHAAAGSTSAIGTAPTAVLPAGTSMDWNFVAANYSLGSATIYGGFTTTRHDAPTPLDHSQSWNVAGKYVLGEHYELMANYLERDSKIATAGDATLVGFGANYLINKSANLFLRYESQRIDSTATVASSHQEIWGTGIRYQF